MQSSCDTLLSVTNETQSWTCAGQVVSLESPVLVGILNVTPDSFSDGGQFATVADAVDHAFRLIKDGAGIIDIGGESTRPGAARVSANEQIARTCNVIRGIREQNDVCISIDTTLAEVAKEALQAGANFINDVAAGTEDDAMFELAASTGAGLVLMHRRLPPEKDHYSDQYDETPVFRDVVEDVLGWLLSRAEAAERVGVKKEAIALDPGFGFGKSVEQNWQLVEGSSAFVASGYPIYAGLSRKSFIGATAGIEHVESRDTASAVAALEMAMQGVQIFRVHNVYEHARVLQSLPSANH